MDHMNHASSSIFYAEILSWLFLAGTLFYAFRLCNRKLLHAVNGYFDADNEVWHALCLLGMASCLSPNLVPVPTLAWSVIFSSGTIWYLIRAFSFGRKLAHNKQWYDFAHAGMLFGMWWMFTEPAKHPLITIGFSAYWIWFGSYYALRIYHDFKKPHWLSFGQDIAHFVMSLVMALMIMNPTAFMHHQDMKPVALSSAVSIVTDSNFDKEVANSPEQLVLLVFGGCEACAREIPTFNSVANDFGSSSKFLRLHKDECPQSCLRLGVKNCPKVFVLRDKQVVASLEGVTSEAELRDFLSKNLLP